MRAALSPDLHIHALRGGLLLRASGRWVLIDAGQGLSISLRDEIAQKLHAVLISSGSMSSIGGLFPLLHRRAMAPEPTLIASPLTTERPAYLLEAWQRGWPEAPPLILDAIHPGGRLEIGEVTFEAVGLEAGEIEPGSPPQLTSAPCLGWSIRGAHHRVAVARRGAPSRSLDRLLAGADLAIIGIDRTPWPPSARPLRLSPEHAARYETSAKELWILEESGEPYGGPAH
ncbi:MAG: hypothetical protein EA397_18995 [Deltaproteobacteria bacterium]|nr:MAG: hypothetical protein EA397_18995 [Deltaproteobacteria bacterium]